MKSSRKSNLPDDLKQEIRSYLSKKVREKFDKREELRQDLEDQDLPFHRRILHFLGEDELKRLLFEGSFVHGLHTSMGNWYQYMAGRIAVHHFGLPQNRQVTQVKVRGYLSEDVVACISKIMLDLDGKVTAPNYLAEGRQIKEAILRSDPDDKTHDREIMVDLYVPEAKDWLLAVEMKTPKTNISIFRGEKRKLLELRALLFQEFPDKPIDKFKVCLAFSYNPYKTLKGFEKKWGFGKKLIDYGNDLLIGEDFWNFIGGEGTYQSLLNVVRQVGYTLKAKDFR